MCRSADEIRKHFCRDAFDLCTIVNAKSGQRSKDCRFCAQSARRHTGAAEYSLLPTEEIVAQAQRCAQQGVARDLIVTSGKRLPEEEVERMREAVGAMRARAGIAVCVSFGLLRRDQYRQ